MKIEDKTYDFLNNLDSNKEIANQIIESDFKDYVAHILTDTKLVIQSFIYKRNGKTLLIPEPNPIVIYFSNAQNFLSALIESREELFEVLNTKNPNVSELMNISYRFFGLSANYVTSLFNSLEAFINSEIPNDFLYKRESKQKTEIFNKEQLQRELRFEEKIKKVIPLIKKKKFHEQFSHKYEIIIAFKEFRDDIVHTKADKNNSPNYYQNLFTKALDFDYNKTIYIVKDYINFYHEGLIEKCDCGRDF